MLGSANSPIKARLKADARAEIAAIKARSKTEARTVRTRAKTEIRAVRARTLQTLASSETRYARKLELQAVRQKEAQIPKRYSVGEEIFNSITHGVGAGLAIAALVLLIVRAVVYAPRAERAFFVTGVSIFGATLIILYLMSTLYHALTPYHVKKVFGIFDHSSIYLLISGTYTPFCLGVLRASGGWWLFGVIWGLSALGITLYAVFGSRLRAVSAVTYVVMGWLIFLAWKPLCARVPPISSRMLLAGGAAYTVGVVFYALKKIKWTHCVWHLFVLAGSVLHFFSVFFSMC